jgi:nicotinamide-nucleotide amidase
MSASIAEILTIGDEVLRGEIVDSNKAYLSDRLLQLDIECHYQTSVRDDVADMTDAFLRAVGRSGVVLVSGGLGPTRDDLTAKVLADTFGRELRLDDASLEAIRGFFASVGREMAENNAKQAYFPDRADVLPNPIGTAPGFAIEERGTLIFCLPGVPRELHLMMDQQVVPRLEARGRGSAHVVRTALLRTFGVGESSLDADLKDIATGSDVSLGFRTSFPDNFLRPTARGATPEVAEARLGELVIAIRERLGAVIYSEEDENLETVVGRLLRECGQSIAVAESCTGGLIAEKVTDVPGSSAYFLGGVVAYSNAAKVALLDVSQAELDEHGAVSEPVARAMAEGVRARFGANIGVATTGISGPDGGSDEKPVGFVCIALSNRDGTHVESFVFPLDRTRHRALTSQVALDWVRRSLSGHELVGPTLLRRRGGTSAPTSGVDGSKA